MHLQTVHFYIQIPIKLKFIIFQHSPGPLPSTIRVDKGQSKHYAETFQELTPIKKLLCSSLEIKIVAI